ncbi:MAG: amidohydrolase family protein [Pseudomonadota bacterium]
MAKKRSWIALQAQRDEWLSKVQEPIVDPDREIVDPHHHLWDRENALYELDHFWADTETGHKIVQTVFVECGESYRTKGPDHLRPVGETEYVAAMAKASAADPARATIAGIVSHADLRSDQLDEVLDAHEDAGCGLFCGIRQSGAYETDEDILTIRPRGVHGLYADPAFRRGLAKLGERGLTYDTWHFHHQIADFRALAEAVPGTTLVMDHFGTPLGVGPYAGKRQEIFAKWKDDIAAVAACPNVIAKLGGMAMPDNGFGWHERDLPPTSDEFVEAQAPWYHHTIECFGPERCMFESNFPVDRASISYPVLWNGLKKIAASYSEEAQVAMLSDTARRVYRLA